jgi:tetratricopeptide (TPR) repeat protein
MAKDAEGDRQTQLDLVTAYTRLADLQGNSYHQNLGDTQGALNSIGKAIALAQTLAGPESKDREAIRALASAQISRSEIMFGTAPIEEAIAATQAAIASFDRLIPIPGVTAAELCQAGGAQALLGDELGINDATSLNDPARALIAYRKDLELINRAAHIDPNIQTVRWDLIIITLKIAQTEAETDPAQAIKDVETALDRIVSLPTEEQQALKIVRVRQDLLLEEADSMVQVGKDAEANSILTAAVGIHKKLITADPQDSRALFDLVSDLNQQAQEYELEADPDLGVSPESRKRNLSLAASAETQEIDLMGQMLKRSPSEDDLRILLADSQVHLATIQSTLRIGADSSDLAKRGLAGLRDLISGKPGIESAGVLDSAAQDFMLVEPESLRNPQLALTYAERAAGLSQRKRPAILLTLAKAYRATGQPDKSRATANEGLALLAPAVGDQAKPVIRRLLQFEATK